MSNINSSSLLLILAISSPIVKSLYGMLNLGVGKIWYFAFEIFSIFILLFFKSFFINTKEKFNSFGKLKYVL